LGACEDELEHALDDVAAGREALAKQGEQLSRQGEALARLEEQLGRQGEQLTRAMDEIETSHAEIGRAHAEIGDRATAELRLGEANRAAKLSVDGAERASLCNFDEARRAAESSVEEARRAAKTSAEEARRLKAELHWERDAAAGAAQTQRRERAVLVAVLNDRVAQLLGHVVEGLRPPVGPANAARARGEAEAVVRLVEAAVSALQTPETCGDVQRSDAQRDGE
jgi:chromosome segregation ATPase